MSLSDKAREAREKAQPSIEPADHMLANALESALDAQAREQLDELRDPVDPLDYFPPPPISEIRIPRPKTLN